MVPGGGSSAERWRSKTGSADDAGSSPGSTRCGDAVAGPDNGEEHEDGGGCGDDHARDDDDGGKASGYHPHRPSCALKPRLRQASRPGHLWYRCWSSSGGGVDLGERRHATECGADRKSTKETKSGPFGRDGAS